MFDEETTREAGGPAGDTHLQYNTVHQAIRRDGSSSQKNWVLN